MLKAGINAAPWLLSTCSKRLVDSFREDGRQNERIGCAHIAGEIDTFFLARLEVVQVNLDIG
jgi:hypothetical protein